MTEHPGPTTGTLEANPLAELIAGVRRLIPEQATGEPGAPAHDDPTPDWDELARAVDELVDVVMVQQDLIENLLMRMSRLEGREVSPIGTTGRRHWGELLDQARDHHTKS